jgi:Cu+-exporting ATPase
MDAKETSEKKEHVDPVCGMTVTGDSRFQYGYKGEQYYFCSEHCLREFREHPQQYLKKQATPA